MTEILQIQMLFLFCLEQVWLRSKRQIPKIIPLKMGVDLKSPSLYEEETRVATLSAYFPTSSSIPTGT